MIRAAIAAVCITTAAQAQPTDIIGPRIGTFEAGLVCNPLILELAEAPGTIGGTVNILDDVPEITVDSRRVPAVVGISFGALVMSAVRDIPMIDMTVTHPPMGADGITQQTYFSRLSATETFPILYSIEEDRELVTGIWTFEARDGDDLILRFSFEVVPPQTLPDLANLCGYENLLS